jgi:hypothetical protein
LKEWAHAGFAVDFVGASLSWAFVGGGLFNVLFPLLFLSFLLYLYVLWKRS